MGSWEEQWITEAFSEYASGLAMRQAKGKGEPAYKEMAEKWLVSAKEGSPIAPIPLANRIHDSTGMVNSRRVRQQLLYFKGARLLFDLHARLGDKDFFTFLWNYQSHLQWKFGTTQNMVELLQAITGKDHGPWFEEHYWGTKLP
jgi:aminopeptidase N